MTNYKRFVVAMVDGSAIITFTQTHYSQWWDIVTYRTISKRELYNMSDYCLDLSQKCQISDDTLADRMLRRSLLVDTQDVLDWLDYYNEHSEKCMIFGDVPAVVKKSAVKKHTVPAWSDFASWMKAVDTIIGVELGVSVHDLPDALYRDEYDCGESPLAGAWIALEAADDFGELYDLRDSLGDRWAD